MAAQHQVLSLARGMAHTTKTLAEYLPGLSLGLVALSASNALLPESTLRALRIEYGADQVRAILSKAGVVDAYPVDDAAAIALLRARSPGQLPKREVVPQQQGLDAHLADIGAEAAWQLLGGPDAIAWGSLRVGHIDTGYTEHTAFGFGVQQPWVDTALARTFFAAGSPMDDPGPGGGVDPLAFQMDGHGTRTAATICGHAPSAPGGAYYGIAPRVPLVPVRIANHVWIAHAQDAFAEAVDYLVEDAAVSVISLSMGGFIGLRKRVKAALNKAYDSGVIVVCAAGNVVSDVVSPARLNRTLAIAGVTKVNGNTVPWSGSSHGPEVDISGPAEGIRRAETKGGQSIYRGGGDGTSYATALTAGAAALWLARHGSTLAATYPQPWQRVEAFRHVLGATARVPPSWQPGEFGAGVLDVHALLQAPLPPAAANPSPPV